LEAFGFVYVKFTILPGSMGWIEPETVMDLPSATSDGETEHEIVVEILVADTGKTLALTSQ
jgi:hypothetical protein